MTENIETNETPPDENLEKPQSDDLENSHSDKIEVSMEDNLVKFKTLLINYELDEALELAVESNIPDNEKKAICNEVIDYLSAKKEYIKAVEVSEVGQIHASLMREICQLQYKHFMKYRKYVEAAEWSSEHRLSDKDISKAANFAYAALLKKSKIEEAIEVFDLYGLNKEDVMLLTIAEFNRALSVGEFRGAALLGSKFNFSKEKTIGAAYKAYTKAMVKLDFEDAIFIGSGFRLFKEESVEILNDGDRKSVFSITFSKYIEPYIDEENMSAVEDFFVKLDIKTISDDNFFLKEFQREFFSKIVNKHNKLLNAGKIVKAGEIRDKMHLLNSDVPSELYGRMMECVEKYHNKAIEKGEVKLAVDLKIGYDLFSKSTSLVSFHNLYRSLALILLKVVKNGNNDLAKLILSEYELPKEYSANALLLGVLHLMDKDRVEEAFATQEEFGVKIYDEESKHRVIAKFREIIRKKDFRTAIELAKNFGLGDKFVGEGAFRFWEYKFSAKKYDDAYIVFEEFRIPRRKTKDLATAHYQFQKKESNYLLATKIRKSYRLPISIFELMSEFFSLLFGTPRA